MPKFYINKNQQPSGDYEVHQENICDHAPNIENRIPLGTFNHCNDALQEAKRRFPSKAYLIDGCFYCARVCHHH